MCDSTDCPLSALSLAEIVEGCRDEIARFHRCGSARSYGMELFRRAIIVKDAAAWDAIIELYDGLVRSWCRRSGASEHDDINELVQIVWVKFWQNFTSDKLQRAAQFPQVLIYLKLCSRSAVLDAKRRQAATLLPDDDQAGADPSPPPDERFVDGEQRASFWMLVEGHLHDDLERLLLWLIYDQGLRPAEVHARHPDLFPTAADVYRISRNVLDRLRRSPGLRDWFDAA
jgi:DNA-directed RNA polymerase specialized sigma24 family protein